MSDLKWLAENVETWPNGAIGVEARIRYSSLDAYYYEHFYIKAPIGGLGATVYTREQWQEERYRLGLDKRPGEDLFNWDEAPEWANWGAVDYSGRRYWYGNKPNPEHPHWMAAAPVTLFKRGDTLCDNWKETLTPRPAQRITLQAGDYIETKGVSEADYKKVYDAFYNAEIYAHKEELSYCEAVGQEYFGASLYNQTNCFHSCVVDDEHDVVFTRLLTVDQVINATNAQPYWDDEDVALLERHAIEQGWDTEDNDWIEWSGGECPVSYETLVECRTEVDPEGADTRPACEWDWNTKTNPITHYRLVENAEEELSDSDVQMINQAAIDSDSEYVLVDANSDESDGGEIQYIATRGCGPVSGADIPSIIMHAAARTESLDTLHTEVLELQKEMAHIEAIMIEKKARIMEILGDVFED